jgi:hypothetical protein
MVSKLLVSDNPWQEFKNAMTAHTQFRQENGPDNKGPQPSTQDTSQTSLAQVHQDLERQESTKETGKLTKEIKTLNQFFEDMRKGKTGLFATPSQGTSQQGQSSSPLGDIFDSLFGDSRGGRQGGQQGKKSMSSKIWNTVKKHKGKLAIGALAGAAGYGLYNAFFGDDKQGIEGQEGQETQGTDTAVGQAGATVAASAAGAAATGLGAKAVGKGLAKSALKKIPGVGVGVGGALALERMSQGQYWSAIGEFASGFSVYGANIWHHGICSHRRCSCP